MGKSRHAGGLGWGDGPVSFTLAILIVALVTYVALTGRDVQRSKLDRRQTRTRLATGLEPSVSQDAAG